MEPVHIVRVIHTASDHEVNQLLQSGWVLLSSGFCRGEVPGYDYHSYALGLPKELAELQPEPDYVF